MRRGTNEIHPMPWTLTPKEHEQLSRHLLTETELDWVTASLEGLRNLNGATFEHDKPFVQQTIGLLEALLAYR